LLFFVKIKKGNLSMGVRGDADTKRGEIGEAWGVRERT
jgi:hypothetical protein